MSKESTRNIKDRAIKTALTLAAHKGWHDVTLEDIAMEMHIPAENLYEYFDDKIDILVIYGRMLDRKTLQNTDVNMAEDSRKDILFDLLMERFELLNEDREGITAILDSLCTAPHQAIIGLPHLTHSMEKILAHAGIQSSGVSGTLNIIGFTALYLKTLSVFRKDESSDLAKTMAALDQNLDQAHQWASIAGLGS